MHRVAVNFVPKLLSHDQLEFHIDVMQDMLECAKGDPNFLRTVITVESLVSGSDPETKVQLLQLKSEAFPWPKKARQVRSSHSDSDFFFYYRDVHHGYAQEGQIVNKQYYQKVLNCLHDTVW